MLKLVGKLAMADCYFLHCMLVPSIAKYLITSVIRPPGYKGLCPKGGRINEVTLNVVSDCSIKVYLYLM